MNHSTRKKSRGLAPAALCLLLVVLLPACAGTLGVHEGGFNLISLDEEWAMRDDLMRQVEKEMKVVKDPSAVTYLNRIGDQIVAQTDMAGREWDFGIIRDDSLNAFNLPGGLVYVHTGLLESADRLDELVGVLSHEVAHGTARHGTQLMTRQYGYSILASVVLGQDPGTAERVVAGVVGTGILNDYSRDAEREADRLGVGYMYKADYDPKGMTDFFRVLLELQERKPSHVERFFSSHPITQERIETVEELRSQLPPKRLVSDTPEYQRFRARFR